MFPGIPQAKQKTAMLGSDQKLAVGAPPETLKKSRRHAGYETPQSVSHISVLQRPDLLAVNVLHTNAVEQFRKNT